MVLPAYYGLRSIKRYPEFSILYIAKPGKFTVLVYNYHIIVIHSNNPVLRSFLGMFKSNIEDCFGQSQRLSLTRSTMGVELKEVLCKNFICGLKSFL